MRRLRLYIMAMVAILGAGELGGAVAQALASRECASRVRLVDAAAGPAQGKALDIQQAGAVSGCHTRLDGTADLARIAGCRAVVVADRFGQTSDEWRGEEGIALLRQAAPHLGSAPLVFAGAQQANLLWSAAHDLRIPGRRLIGSSPEALASAIAAIVALEARCSPADVRLAVLGMPPRGIVVPWSEASIGGYALDRVLSAAQRSRIEARVARLWPPGPHALGAAAARLVHALLTASRRSHSVLTPLDGEFGVRRKVGALPVRLFEGGVAETRVPALDTRERVLLETALGA